MEIVSIADCWNASLVSYGIPERPLFISADVGGITVNTYDELRGYLQHGDVSTLRINNVPPSQHIPKGWSIYFDLRRTEVDSCRLWNSHYLQICALIHLDYYVRLPCTCDKFLRSAAAPENKEEKFNSFRNSVPTSQNALQNNDDKE